MHSRGLWCFEERLAFDYREVVWECVKGLHEQALFASLNRNPTDGPQRHATPRLEPVKQAVLGGFHAEFLLERPKHLRRNGLELEAHLIPRATAARHSIAAFTSESVRKEPPLLWQRLACAGCNFSEREPVLAPRDKVTGTRD